MYSQVKSWSWYHFLGGLSISLFLCEEAKKTMSINKNTVGNLLLQPSSGILFL